MSEIWAFFANFPTWQSHPFGKACFKKPKTIEITGFQRFWKCEFFRPEKSKKIRRKKVRIIPGLYGTFQRLFTRKRRLSIWKIGQKNVRTLSNLQLTCCHYFHQSTAWISHSISQEAEKICENYLCCQRKYEEKTIRGNPRWKQNWNKFISVPKRFWPSWLVSKSTQYIGRNWWASMEKMRESASTACRFFVLSMRIFFQKMDLRS